MYNQRRVFISCRNHILTMSIIMSGHNFRLHSPFICFPSEAWSSCHHKSDRRVLFPEVNRSPGGFADRQDVSRLHWDPFTGHGRGKTPLDLLFEAKLAVLTLLAANATASHNELMNCGSQRVMKRKQQKGQIHSHYKTYDVITHMWLVFCRFPWRVEPYIRFNSTTCPSCGVVSYSSVVTGLLKFKKTFTLWKHPGVDSVWRWFLLHSRYSFVQKLRTVKIKPRSFKMIQLSIN